MVKGTKRAIPIKKISEQSSRATCFTKRRDGLYSKAADLCLLSDSQIAVLANSNASFFSFGHSSVDAVVAAFLAGKRPVPVPFHREDVGICLRRKDLGLGFWWDDEGLAKSEDPKELRAAMDSMSRLLQNLRELHSGEAMDNQIVDDEFLKKTSDGTQEIDQTLDSKPTCDNRNQELDQTLNLHSSCAMEEMDLDELIDFECLLSDDEIFDKTVMNVVDNDDWMAKMFSDYETQAVENRAFVLQSGFDEEDDVRFSDDIFEGLM